MDNLTLFLATAGALSALVVGVGLLVLGFRDPPQRPAGPSRLARLDPRSVLAQRRKMSATVAAGLAAGVLSGWPVAAIGAGLAVWFAPVLLGGDSGEPQRIAKIESIAVWAEMLRDTLSSAAGLSQAVLASTRVAPEPIAGPLATLAAELSARRPFDQAMLALAAELAEPASDQIVKTLIYAQRNQVKNLADLLGELAASARAQVGLQVRVHAERAKHRTSQRAITVMFTVMLVGLAVFYPEYLRPYGTVAGQIALLVILGMFAGALAWMRIIVRPKPLPRLFDPNTSQEA